MKRPQSEVKAASEKQQTNGHHEEGGGAKSEEKTGERWWRAHLAVENMTSPRSNNNAAQQVDSSTQPINK